MDKSRDVNQPVTNSKRQPAFKRLKNSIKKWPLGVRWGILVVLILGIAYGGYSIYRSTQPSTTTEGSGSTMQTATARTGSIEITASGSGTLIPHKQASFGFATGGQITQVYAKVGDVVEAGQLLAEMDSGTAQSDYDLVRLNYMNLISPSAIATAEQAILAAQTSLESTRNNLAYMISPGVLTWEEAVAQAQETLTAAQAEATVNPSGTATKNVESAEKTLQNAQTRLKMATSYYYETYIPEYFTVTETDPRTGVESIVYVTDETTGELVPEIEAPSQATINSARASYDLAKAELKEAQVYLAALKGEEIPADATGSKLAQLLSARKSLAAAQEDLDGTRLVAPISGTIVSFEASVGDNVGTGTIITISDLSQPYYLEAYFDESDWTNIRVGYEADVAFDLLPDETYVGKVTEVTPSLVSGGSSGLVHCYVELDSPVSIDLPSGTSATVEVVAGRATNVVIVPVEAVREISAGQYAVFVMENGDPKLRLVEVGLMDDTSAAILSGLSAGEVVTTGIVETNQ